MDIWQLLEKDPPEGCEAVQDLYSWSLNYDPGKGPFTLFLDLIGYTQDEYGETFYDLKDPSLGYLELEKLSEALSEYVSRPYDVKEHVERLMRAEAGLEDEDEDEDEES